MILATWSAINALDAHDGWQFISRYYQLFESWRINESLKVTADVLHGTKKWDSPDFFKID